MKYVSNNGRIAQAMCLLAVLGAVEASGASRFDLRKAVQQGDMQRARDLLRAGVDIDEAPPVYSPTLPAGVPPERHSTLLLEAVVRGDIEVVKRLLQLGADVDKSISGGYTPLVAAAQAGNRPLVRLLLRSGAAVPIPGRGPGQNDYLAPTNIPHLTALQAADFNAMHAATLNLIRQEAQLLRALRAETEREIYEEGFEGVSPLPRDVARLISEHRY